MISAGVQWTDFDWTAKRHSAVYGWKKEKTRVTCTQQGFGAGCSEAVLFFIFGFQFQVLSLLWLLFGDTLVLSVSVSVCVSVGGRCVVLSLSLCLSLRCSGVKITLSFSVVWCWTFRLHVRDHFFIPFPQQTNTDTYVH